MAHQAEEAEFHGQIHHDGNLGTNQVLEDVHSGLSSEALILQPLQQVGYMPPQAASAQCS